MAGCGQVWSSDGTPPPTREPTLTLWGYTLLPPSLTPTPWPMHTVTPLVTADNVTVTVTPVAFHLAATGPACYETVVGSLVCMGQVHNRLDVPVEHVVVGVKLVSEAGSYLATGQGLVARTLLPAGLTGPYRVLFDNVPDGYAGARAFIEGGQVAENARLRYADLKLQQVAGNFVNNQYQVTLSVLNKSANDAWQLAVTMTLLDGDGQVTGFRKVMLDHERRLQPGESLALTIKVIPQGSNTVAFDVFAEGYLAPN